jgi:glyoxylase-like metal-dependent hydrolase (beta-lactamase superfamily II)
MRSPGHTPESVCLRIDNRALFTGDTILETGFGRPDCDAAARGAESRAMALHRTLAHLLSLPGDMLVLPSHRDATVPWPGSPAVTTLARAISFEGWGQDDRAFVRLVLDRLRDLPPPSPRIVKLNEKGEFSEAEQRELEG